MFWDDCVPGRLRFVKDFAVQLRLHRHRVASAEGVRREDTARKGLECSENHKQFPDPHVLVRAMPDSGSMYQKGTTALRMPGRRKGRVPAALNAPVDTSFDIVNKRRRGRCRFKDRCDELVLAAPCTLVSTWLRFLRTSMAYLDERGLESREVPCMCIVKAITRRYVSAGVAYPALADSWVYPATEVALHEKNSDIRWLEQNVSSAIGRKYVLRRKPYLLQVRTRSVQGRSKRGSQCKRNAAAASSCKVSSSYHLSSSHGCSLTVSFLEDFRPFHRTTHSANPPASKPGYLNSLTDRIQSCLNVQVLVGSEGRRQVITREAAGGLRGRQGEDFDGGKVG
eukprot:830934-Rhodomonas_salina.2